MTDDGKKPVLDEQTFGRLLEAAHVLQEHGRTVRELEQRVEMHNERVREQELDQRPGVEQQATPPARPSDYTVTLAQIVEVQRQIQVRHLELDRAIGTVAEQVMAITGAAGSGVGILDGKLVRYRAGSGTSALPAGTEVPLASAVCAACIRTGQVIRSDDVNTEVLFDPEPCRQRGILSLLAVPVYHDGDIVGALELYFDKVRGYAEQDIHTCQLLAGLITEALGRDSERSLKHSMAEERSNMLAALEKLQPNLGAASAEQSVAAAVPPKTDSVPVACWKCGERVLAGELFCGHCGAACVAGDDTSSMQSKLASAWHKQQAASATAGTPLPEAMVNPRGEGLPAPTATHNDLFSGPVVTAVPMQPPFENTVEDPTSLHASGATHEDVAVNSAPPRENELLLEDDSVAIPGALTQSSDDTKDDQVWSSAAKTRDFLEGLAGNKKSGKVAAFWEAHRGDIYLAVAVVLVIVVIRWGLWSNHSVAARGRAQQAAVPVKSAPQAPDNDLSVTDKWLIRLGLAEAPEPPQDKGNPDIQVWEDLHTALYYCAGSDQFGKTPNGKIATQRDAQLDQFEPANRKPCR